MTIDATPESRSAHHEAGHAVAVVHADWLDDLEPLWPAVCAVAAALLRGEVVSHATVQAALDQLLRD